MKTAVVLAVIVSAVLGEVPAVLVEAATWAGALAAVMTCMALLHRTPPVQWLLRSWREDRDDALAHAIAMGTAELSAAVKSLDTALEDHRRYVHYHLGPNDTTKPVHRRLVDLEIAHRIEQEGSGDAT